MHRTIENIIKRREGINVHDELDIPDFLLVKNREPDENRRRGLKLESDRGIVCPPKRDTSEYRKAARDRTLEACPNELTASEKEELAEIKAMLGTSVEHAKRMASEWISRNTTSKIQARRRKALQTVKGIK